MGSARERQCPQAAARLQGTPRVQAPRWDGATQAEPSRSTISGANSRSPAGRGRVRHRRGRPQRGGDDRGVDDARKELLAKEKDLTRQWDALNAARRNLPMVEVQKDYTFDGGRAVRLIDKFASPPRPTSLHDRPLRRRGPSPTPSVVPTRCRSSGVAVQLRRWAGIGQRRS